MKKRQAVYLTRTYVATTVKLLRNLALLQQITLTYFLDFGQKIVSCKTEIEFRKLSQKGPCFKHR